MFKKQTTAAADTPNRQANTDAQSERPGSMEVITEGRSNASSDGKVARPTKGHRFEQRRPPQSRSAPPPSSGKDGSENSNDGVGFKTAAGPPSREVEGSASDTTYHSFVSGHVGCVAAILNPSCIVNFLFAGLSSHI